MSHTFGQKVVKQIVRADGRQPACTCGFGYRRAAHDWRTCAECGGQLRSDEEIEDARRETMEEAREDARRDSRDDREDY